MIIMSAALQSGKVTMCIVSFKTLTAAQHAKRQLASDGIFASVTGIDPTLTKRGCSFGIGISETDRRRALKIFESKHIEYGDVLG